MRRILTLLLLFSLSPLFASPFSTQESQLFKQFFIDNLMPSGAMVASPSKHYPDYYYHWVRDAAIAMNLVVTWYEKDGGIEDKQRLLRYVDWVTTIQHQVETLPNQDILGEPKYYMDSRPYAGSWGRPQNDGPALRALALTRMAFILLKEDEDYVKTHLYRGGLEPSQMGAIKLDLEYIAHHWQDENYDLWEEVYGHHFFNRMVQRKALLKGAQLANRLDDLTAATYYQTQAKKIELSLEQFIDKQNQLIQATLPPHPGPQKTLELDSAILLAVLLGDNEDGVFSLDNTLVENTVLALSHQFKQLYPINMDKDKAILFGRYPGDTYDGYRNDGDGNPWYLLTASMAEFYYRKANLEKLQLSNKQKAQLIALGDDYLSLIKKYAPNLHLAEQINLESGVPQGANDLTWSYVAVLRALNYRELALR